ncbi:MAG: hypothetical protein JXA66_04305 [Oligoflexia bacterium]|nr:hypothetical protein [Oligoflexia bacterium]
MVESRSSVYSADKAVNRLYEADSTFLFKFSAQSILKVFVGDLSFVQRVYGPYVLSSQVRSSLKEGYDYHSVEFNLSRGFTDSKIFGLLTLGYRFGRFDRNEQWMVFSTSTGFIPAPWGIKSAIAYYMPFTANRYGRLRADVTGLYRVSTGKSYFDLGIHTSFYIIPSGEFGVPELSAAGEENAVIEEFMQFEGGIVVCYALRETFLFELIVSNIFFVNQKNYEIPNETDDQMTREYKTVFSYAPKALLGFIFKF